MPLVLPQETHDTVLPTSTYYNEKIKRLEEENKELQDSFELLSWMCKQSLKEIQTVQQEKAQLQRELDDKNNQFLEKEQEHQQMVERLMKEGDKTAVNSGREGDKASERTATEGDELHHKKKSDEDDENTESKVSQLSDQLHSMKTQLDEKTAALEQLQMQYGELRVQVQLDNQKKG